MQKIINFYEEKSDIMLFDFLPSFYSLCSVRNSSPLDSQVAFDPKNLSFIFAPFSYPQALILILFSS